jgi:hypothetical protein
MPLTDYSLDTFIAPKLSLLTKCNAPELLLSSNWLSPFILNTMFVIPIYPANSRRTCMVAFLRRAEATFLTYRKAREQLIEYLIPRPQRVFSLYFESVLYFETCLSQWSQAADILRAVFQIDYFKTGDNSKEQRINSLYNDTKHLDEKRALGEIADATPAIWITNDGLEGRSGVLSFSELHEAVLEIGTLARKWCAFGKTQ